MANRIILKKSSVASKIPVPEDLEYGELALNYTDGRLYYKNNVNNIEAISSASFIDTAAANGLLIHASTVSQSYTVLAGNNVISAGPIVIDDDVSVTITDGVWVVV